MNSGDWVTYLVITACFIAGYSIVSFLFKKMKSSNSSQEGGGLSDPSGDQKKRSGNSTEGSANSGANQENGERTRYRREGQEQKKHSHNNFESYGEERKYATILGLGVTYTSDEIKKAFRELIAKYHPDKVNHLGKEFQKISEERTREIMEAYEYFRKLYNIK
jgi:hypothetical protein